MQDASERLEQVMNEVLSDKDIALEQIPDLDLYMDQVITMLDQGLAKNKRTEGEKLITKTMINNYSKEGLVKQGNGKKYSKEHILKVLFIYQLKQSLSIQDIKKLFSACLSEEVDIPELYQEYLQIKQDQKKELPKAGEVITPRLYGTGEKEDQFLMIMSMISLSNSFRRIAEAMIDALPSAEKKAKNKTLIHRN